MARVPRRLAALLAVTALAAPLTVAALTTSAGAGPVKCVLPAPPDPDTVIRGLEGFNPAVGVVGRDIYNLNGDDQEVEGGIVPGAIASWAVRARNVADGPRTIRVNVDGIFLTVFRLKVFLGDTKLDNGLVRDGILFPNVAPGSSTPKLRVQVKLKRGTVGNFEIHLASQSALISDEVHCGDLVLGSASTAD